MQNRLNESIDMDNKENEKNVYDRDLNDLEWEVYI